MSHVQLVTLAASRLRQAELDHRHSMERRGRTFLGPHRVLQTIPSSVALGVAPAKGIRPRYARHCAALLHAAVQRVRSFWDAHRTARLRHKAKDNSALFPPGTYAVAQFLGLPVAAAPPSGFA